MEEPPRRAVARLPLARVSIWVLLRSVPGVLAWTARVAALGYVTFYSGLDILTGIGVGALLQRQSDVQAIEAVAAIGRDLGRVGTVFFIVACVAISLALFKRVGRAAILWSWPPRTSASHTDA